MKFASSYEPGAYEPDIYAAWETSGVFNPNLSTKPVDDDGNVYNEDERWEHIKNSFETEEEYNEFLNHIK